MFGLYVLFGTDRVERRNVRMKNPPKTPLPEVWGVGKRKHRGLYRLHGTNLRIDFNILRLLGSDKAFRIVLVAVSLAVLTALLVIALLAVRVPLDLEGLRQTLSPLERVPASSKSLEVWAPIVFFSIQAFRVILPLVPAGPVTLAGVAAFGPWWGFALSLLGAFVGSVSAFLLARRFSHPLVAWLVGEKTLEKHAGKMGADGRWMFVALVMPIPAVGDAVCTLAGLSEISLRRFAVLNLVGRIPYTAFTVLLASGLNFSFGSLQAGWGIIATLLPGTAFFYIWRRRSQQRY